MRGVPIVIPIVLLLTFFTVRAQTVTFTSDDIDFILELPSPTWKAVSRLDVHDHVEFRYGLQQKRIWRLASGSPVSCKSLKINRKVGSGGRLELPTFGVMNPTPLK